MIQKKIALATDLDLVVNLIYVILLISNRIFSVTNFLNRNMNYPNLPDVDAITNAAYVRI